MKRLYSLMILCSLMISLVFYACTNNENSNYVINNDETIKIGVIVLSEEDNGFYSGIKYASELAHSVNIDKKYEIETKVALYSDNLSEVASDFANENVAAVICEGNDKTTTDSIIEAFSEYSTPLVFTDAYSEKIEKSDNAFSISIPYSYQVSAAVSHLIAQGLKTGAVVCSGDNNYNKSFAKMFDTAFVSNGGTSVTTYYFQGEGSNFNANTISASNYDFVFLIGNINDNIKAYTELKSAEVSAVIVFSEVSDKTLLETSDYNNVTFISKFEADDNNYIGTDFINTYAENMDISTFDVTACVAYGYDAYMTVYDALVSMHKNSGSIFNTTEASTANEDTSILCSDVSNALKSIKHMGVTDVIRFNDNGLIETSFVYMDKIENSRSGMLQRYNYANE